MTRSSDPRRKGMRNRLTAAALSLVAALVMVSPAAAIDPVLVDGTPGVTAPKGIFRDAHGALWVADSHAGICRIAGGVMVADDPNTGPVFCDPTGLLTTRIGPVAPGQSAYDATTGTIYVGDLASGSGGVWRMHLDPNGGSGPSVIRSPEKIYDVSLVNRVFGMSYHAGLDVLDFSTKNSPNILRITNPRLCVVPCVPGNAGSAEANATTSLAHDSKGNIYIADLSGVTRIVTGSSDSQARPVAGLNLGFYTAVAYDPDNDRIYAGTTNAEGLDWIDVLDHASNFPLNKTGTYSIGFDGITAIAPDPNSSGHAGRLDVIDDPGIKQVGEDLGGTGRHYTVDFEQFVPPPTIVDGPPPIANVRVASFFFANLSPTTFFCSLDLAPATSCGTGTQGSIAYPGLASGAHSFVLYGNNPLTGPRTIRRFAIDTRAPVASIDTTTITGASAEFGLSADDINVDFTCGIDGGIPTSCDTPVRYAGLANGPHTFTVHATDFVGNVGPTVSKSFQIGPPATPIWKAGKVKATLRGTTLRVIFNAPPGATFARFTLSKTSGIKIRTKTVLIKGGKTNTITITLTRAEAQRLQRQTVTLKITAGARKTSLTTKAGQGKLTVAVRLTHAKGR